MTCNKSNGNGTKCLGLGCSMVLFERPTQTGGDSVDDGACFSCLDIDEVA